MVSMKRWPGAYAWALIAGLLAAACGDSDTPDDGKRTPPSEGKPAQILSFEVSEPTVSPGETVHLSWATEDADFLLLLENGRPIEIPAAERAEGSRAIELWEETRFELMATGSDGAIVSETRKVSLAPREVKVLSFSAASEVVDAGQRTSLRWESTGARSVTIVDDGGAVLLEDFPQPSGSIEVQVLRDTTFTLRAKGADDQVAVETISVEVRPSILAFAVRSDPGPVAPGTVVQLSWHVLGAKRIQVSNLENFDDGQAVGPDDEDSLLVPVGSQGQFRLTAWNGPHSSERTIEVPVLRAPRISLFQADRPFWTHGTMEAVAVTLSWEIEDAASIELDSDSMGAIEVGGADPARDSVVVLPNRDTVFTLRARNAAGESSAQAEVRFVPLPTVELFAGIPARSAAGAEIDLVWKTRDAVAVSIADESGAPLLTDAPPEGSTKILIAGDATFALRAWNAAGDWVEEHFSVSVGAPINVDFAPSRAFVAVDEGFELRWRNFGGSSLEIRNEAGEILCTASSFEEVFEGSCPHSENATGEYTYTLTVVDGMGQRDEVQTRVQVTNGPLVYRFEVTPSELTEGESFTVSWEVGDDAGGGRPTLLLTDGVDTLPLDDQDPNQGAKSFVAGRSGEITLRLEARSEAGSSHASQDILVHPAPTLALVADPPVYDGSRPLTLSWTTQGSEASLELYTFDRLGQRIEPPLYVVPASERASGSFSVEPPIWDPEVEYLLVGTNALGVSDETRLRVPISEPIAVFEADPPEVVAGDPVDLVWDVRMADTVRLDHLFLEVQETEDLFEDIRNTGTDLGLGGSAKELWATIDLSAHGLTIPWGKKDFDYVRVTERGFLTFGQSLVDDRRGNIEFSSFHHLNFGDMNWFELSIAPYWGGIETRGPGSHVKAAFVPNPAGRHRYIVQWTGANRDSEMSDRADTDMTFQVVLTEDGEFDLRYGAMMPVDEPQANGARVTIGYMLEGEWKKNPETPIYGPYHQLHYGGATLGSGSEAFPGGLSHRTFAYRYPRLPLAGRHTYVPQQSETRELLAIGATKKRFTTKVVVHPRATVTAIAPRGEVEEKAPFSVGWETTDATEVQVLDANGSLRCTSTPANVAEGSCSVTEQEPGFYVYTVRAIGALGHQVDTQVVVQVWPALHISEFSTSAQEVDWNQPIVLRWKTGGAHIFRLTANGVPLDLQGQSWEDGQLVVHPREETLFRLELETLDGRAREAETRVLVRTFHWESASANGDRFVPGEELIFDWDIRSFSGTPPTVFVNAPLQEVDASPGSPHAFEDIKGVGTRLEMQQCPGGPTSVNSEGCELLVFPNGFTFPFGGEQQTALWVFVKGIASFDGPPGRNTLNNRSLPKGPGEEGAFVNFAPFWDNLFYPNGTTGDIWYHLDESDPNNRKLIVQWNKLTFLASENDTDLTFQIVLFEDGAFEYRYLIMHGHTETYELRAQGSSATVGYQFPGGYASHTIHQGGEASSSGDVFPGGFTGRSWRSEPMDASTGKVRVLDSHDYRLCARIGTYLECRDFPVQAEWEIRKFEADRLRVEAHEPVRLSWETLQGESISLFANGVEIDVSHLDKDQGSIVHHPREKTTYLLRLHSLWRTKEAEVTVEVDTFRNLVVSSDRRVVAAGEPVTISWNAESLVDGDPHFDPVLPFMVEVDDAPYLSISPDGTASGTLVPGLTTRNRLATIEFPAGFTFPYYGKEHHEVHVSNMGYLSFDPAEASSTASGNTTAHKIPATSLAAKHMPVFWDGIYRTAQGSDVYWEYVQDVVRGDHVIIDFYNFSYTSSTSASYVNRDRLHFQVYLYADGRFEYRFGEMSSTSSTYDHRARGSQAMIGYQDPTGTMGQTVSWATDHPEGLSERSWRYTPPQIVGKQVTIYPQETFVPRVCAELGGYRHCVESEPVNVLRPGDLLISELMVDPITGSQWFEVRNMTGLPVDLEGFVIRTDVGSHTIASSLPIPKGGYAVLAAGDDVEFTPDYVYGMTLYPTDGFIALERGGTTVARVDYDVTWPHQKGHSFTLDPMKHLEYRIGVNGSQMDYCVSIDAYGSGGNHGTPGGHALPCTPTGPYAVDFHAPVDGLDIRGIATPIWPGEVNYNLYQSADQGMALPFAFPYYGENFSTVWINSNGLIAFGPFTSSQSSNGTIPGTSTTLVNGVIAPFWDALNPAANLEGGQVESANLEVDGKKVVVIRWLTTPSSGRTREANANIDFQLQLWEDGTFDFVYNEINDGHQDSKGASATIGFQKKAPSAQREGYLFSYNDRQTRLPTTGRVVRITPLP